ncbi:uncharacterized protein LOC124284108 [Haliotis rubra]|uniref:uncharacterized protein LOC124284108 n=1 Tax=Haliotis rubra TaxID=36100 RepID=UPI001EE5E044|nr:uncharacterized protein LOC124284108 [Haliotis rubra]
MAFLALKERYGQSRQLVQSELRHIMNLPQVRYGDSEGFENFALSVHSLVGILRSVDGDNSNELRCWSHVDRLLSKMSQSHRDSFIEHCLNKGILTADGGCYTLVDFSNWLQVKARAKRIAAASAPQYEKPERSNQTNNTRQRQEKATHTKSSPTAVFNTNMVQKSSESSPKPKPSKFEKFRYCPYCNNNDHFLHRCPHFSKMTTQEIADWIKRGSRCSKCARFHKPENCTLKKPCHECNNLHLTALHEVMQTGVDKIYSLRTDNSEFVYADQPSKSPNVLLKVVKVLLHGPNDRKMETYALLDDGSMRTMVLQPAVNELKLPSTPDKVLLTTIRQDPFWCTGFNVDLQISTTDHPDLRYDITGAFSADNLCLSEYNYPVRELQATYPHLRDLPLPTISQACPMILIESDHADLILPQKPVVFGADGSPVAICTLLGWTLQGPTKEISPQKAVQSYYTALERKATLMNHVERLWQLDVLPYSEKKVVRSKQDIEALHMLEAQTELATVDGVQRYATPLLRAKDAPKFEATEAAVMPILKRTEKRLASNPDLADIHNHLIEKLVTAGYVRILTPDEIKGTESWYFPHHVVDHNGKYRLVFNCSYNSAGISLNNYLLPGPVLGPVHHYSEYLCDFDSIRSLYLEIYKPCFTRCVSCPGINHYYALSGATWRHQWHQTHTSGRYFPLGLPAVHAVLLMPFRDNY